MDNKLISIWKERIQYNYLSAKYSRSNWINSITFILDKIKELLALRCKILIYKLVDPEKISLTKELHVKDETLATMRERISELSKEFNKIKFQKKKQNFYWSIRFFRK